LSLWNVGAAEQAAGALRTGLQEVIVGVEEEEEEEGSVATVLIDLSVSISNEDAADLALNAGFLTTSHLRRQTNCPQMSGDQYLKKRLHNRRLGQNIKRGRE
jgi:hypothetical protein